MDVTKVELLPRELSVAREQPDTLALLVAWDWGYSFSFSVEFCGVCWINRCNQFTSALNG